MCKFTSHVFHHACAHTLIITTPSLNPQCTEEREHYQYLEEGRCPRCAIWGGRKDEAWDGWGQGVVCGGHDRETTQNLRIEVGESDGNSTTDDLWSRREGFLRRLNMWRLAEERKEFEEMRQLEEERGTTDKKARTYFLNYNNSVKTDDGEFFVKAGDLDNGIVDVRCWCEDDLGLLEEKRLRDQDQHQLVSLPCGDIFHEMCIKKHFASSSNSCPACRHSYSIKRAQPSYLPSGFEEEMMAEWLCDGAAEKGGWWTVADWVLDLSALIALLAFMYCMPLWICMVVVFMGFAMATLDAVGGDDKQIFVSEA